MTEIYRRCFTLGRVKVEEVIYDLGEKNKKMAWALYPFNDLIVNGSKNPLTYFEYEDSPKNEEEARNNIRVRFVEDHKEEIGVL